MNKGLKNPITEKLIQEYEENGAVCIRGQFDQGWIDRITSAAEKYIEDPTKPT